MKNYEEMAQSALTRGKAIRKQRRSFIWTHVGILSALGACCLLLILTLGNRGVVPNLNPTENVHNPEQNISEITFNFGQVNFLSAINKTDTGLSGKAFQYIVGTQNAGIGISAELAMPTLEFQYSTVQVVAKAVEELGIYETTNEYGSTYTAKYRVFYMSVIDPLQSGMNGTFYYKLPADLKGDLTQYDELLISMSQCPKNFVLSDGGKLTAFDYLFGDPQNAPELGNMIAFKDGVFDATIWEIWWQDRVQRYGYRDLRDQLNAKGNNLIVSEGATLEDVLRRRQAQIEKLEELEKPRQVKHYDFQTEAAQQLMTYLQPFENGIFIPEQFFPDYRIRRYINGCPTNERYSIDYAGENVILSEYRFEDEDFNNLPDIATYIADLDLAQIAPQHTDTTGKVLIYNTAVGWYEKTENGVYSIVRITWRYFDQDDRYVEYYDETFILLDETGDHIISKGELIELIGDNPNISDEEYGVGIAMPTM